MCQRTETDITKYSKNYLEVLIQLSWNGICLVTYHYAWCICSRTIVKCNHRAV